MEKKPSIKIPFGLHNGELIHISQIKEQNLHGLACGCICPCCQAPLEARISKNNKKQAHFSHSSQGCSSQQAYETAIHLLAKKIISKKRTLLFPAIIKDENDIPQIVEIKDQYFYLLDDLYSPQKTIEIKPSKYVDLDVVEIERTIGDIKPDLIVHSGKNICFVEIAVTHFIDETKKDKFKALDYPVIEINLSNLYNKNLELDELEYEIIDNPKNRKWIHYPLLDKAIENAVNKYKQKEIYNTKNEEIKNHTNYINQYRAELKRLRNDELLYLNLKQLNFYKELYNSEFPFFLDIPISGEVYINCDRRIWQSIIFDKFIYNRTSEELSFRKIEWWLKNYNKSFSINWIKDVEKSDIALIFYKTIKKYLRYLSFLGFISPIYEKSKNNYYTFEAVIWNSHSLNVLNQCKERADVLSNAIAMVNSSNINPDELIERMIHKELNIDLYDSTTSKSPCDWILD